MLKLHWINLAVNLAFHSQPFLFINSLLQLSRTGTHQDSRQTLKPACAWWFSIRVSTVLIVPQRLDWTCVAHNELIGGCPQDRAPERQWFSKTWDFTFETRTLQWRPASSPWKHRKVISSSTTDKGCWWSQGRGSVFHGCFKAIHPTYSVLSSHPYRNEPKMTSSINPFCRLKSRFLGGEINC